MSDPVWFGNYIIPRWEALALIGFGIFFAVAVFGITLGLFVELMSSIVRWVKRRV